MTFDYDYLIAGSGFGGSVSALRLAEKGWKVGVVEQGRKVEAGEIGRAKKSIFKLMWVPWLGLRGYFVQHLFPHLTIVGGVGVGGGSLVWAAVMLEPKDDFYDDPSLQQMGVDWKQELAPHFATAKRMLGVAINPHRSRQDELLEMTAQTVGAADTFGSVPNAIYFDSDREPLDDPYFNGLGPKRSPCNFCGGCLTGCEINAKNSLDKNYLHLAQNNGAEILPNRKVDLVEPLPEGGYRVTLVNPVTGRKLQTLSCQKLVLSAGVVGTLEILAKNRDKYDTLSNIPECLGDVVRTNSEAITAVLHQDGEDLTDGTAISTHFHPDENTHITQNRFDRGYRFMRFMMVPMVDGERPLKRAVQTLGAMITAPGLMFNSWFSREWEKRITVFTVMQDLDNSVRLKYKRSWFHLFRRGLVTEPDPEHAAPTYLPVANKVTREYARKAGGAPMNTIMESVGNLSATAHILGGCPMGPSPQDSVIDSCHEVHVYPGLFVVDGASIPANIGVNPSLTITAMAERFAALQPYAMV